MSNSVGILGLGSCLPEKVLTNADLEKMVDTSDEWIVKRTGISERRVLEKDVPIHTLGVKAAQGAIENAGLTPEDIDLIIATTETPDYLTPSMACLIQGKIGATKAAAFDLNAACSGFVYGLSVAKQFVQNGAYKHILLVSCEGLTKVTDWQDRNTCVLFGDGSGAAVIGEVEEGYGILDTYLGADGTMGKAITLPCCHTDEIDLANRPNENKRGLWMDGSEVFKFAVKIMSQATKRIIEQTNLSLDDVKLIVPHQANIRIIDGAIRKLANSDEKVFVNVHNTGNISSASIPVALHQALEAKRFAKGDNIVLVGFGGGLTWASALIRWSK